MICIVGVGTLGCLQAKLWADSGEDIVLIDRDIVEPHNIGQQVLYEDADIGQPKALVAARKLGCTGHAEDVEQRLDLCKADIIIDCTDNFSARFTVSNFAWQHDVPFVYGAAVQEEGSCAVFCRSTCSFGTVFGDKVETLGCDVLGISLATARVVAGEQFRLARSALLGSVDDKMYMIIGTSVNSISLPKGEEIVAVTSRDVVRLCGTSLYQTYIDASIASRLCGDSVFVRVGEHTVFASGRVLVRAGSVEEVALKIKEI